MDPTAEYRSGRRGEAGFTLLAVLVAVAVINIFLGVAVARWSFTMKRHREAELLWRGEKYAQALDCYARQQGAPPTRIEQLVEERCIRRLYEDPVSDSGEWRILRVADLVEEQEEEAEDAVGLGAGSRPAGDTVARSGRGLRARLETDFSLNLRRSPEEMSADRSSLPDRTSLRERVGADRRVGEIGVGGPDGSTPGRDEMDGIVGVVSTSDEESIRPGPGGGRYSDWRFMAGGSEPAVPMLPGLSAVPREASPDEREGGLAPDGRGRDRGLRSRMRGSPGGRRR